MRKQSQVYKTKKTGTVTLIYLNWHPMDVCRCQNYSNFIIQAQLSTKFQLEPDNEVVTNQLSRTRITAMLLSHFGFCASDFL